MREGHGWDRYLIELSQAIRLGDREAAEAALDVMIRDERNNAAGAVESIAKGRADADAILRRKAASVAPVQQVAA